MNIARNVKSIPLKIRSTCGSLAKSKVESTSRTVLQKIINVIKCST